MASQLLTPSPSPPPPVQTPTLPAQINAATRKQHTKLNALIVNRLALALPPNSSNPELLARGLGAFARIYYIFESAWDDIISEAESVDKLVATHDTEVHEWLCNVRPKGLARTTRLKNDIQHLCTRTDVRIDRSTAAEQRILDRIVATLAEKPHVLVAYAWVMYMAIFSGGRWIRQQLSNAGLDFWTGDQHGLGAEKRELQAFDAPGFSFLSFDGDHDGEDIKADFKARLATADTLFSQQEREDMVGEARNLFEDCIALVGMLDRQIWWRTVGRLLIFYLFSMSGAAVIVLLVWSCNSGSQHLG